MSEQRFVRASGYLLIVVGAVLAAGWLIAPNPPTAPDQSLEFSLEAASARWRIGATLILLSTALEFVASVGLFMWLLHRGKGWVGLAGLLFTVLVGALFLPVFGVFIIVLPIVGDLIESGQADALNVIDAYYKEPMSLLPFFGGALFQLRSIVFGFAVWTSGVAQGGRSSGALLALGGAAMIPAFFDVAIMQVVGPLILAGGIAWVGLVITRPGGLLTPGLPGPARPS
jgi:hypothetical protein